MFGISKGNSMARTNTSSESLAEYRDRIPGMHYEDFGPSLEDRARICLNQALAVSGGVCVSHDGVSHNLTEFIGHDLLPQVLAHARHAARKRHFAFDTRYDVSTVVTVDDALRVILGLSE